MLTSVFLCVCGLLMHFASKWKEARTKAEAEGRPPLGARQFIGTVPAQTLSAVVGAVVMYMIADEMGWLNPMTSFAAGWLGNSIAENVAQRYAEVLKTR